MTQFGYANLFEVPRLEKVVINMGVGEAVQNSTRLNAAVEELTRISGQKPVVTRAKKSIAGLKLREGMPIGVTVTLRRERTFAFLARLVNIALPPLRTLQVLTPHGYHGAGSYTPG